MLIYTRLNYPPMRSPQTGSSKESQKERRTGKSNCDTVDAGKFDSVRGSGGPITGKRDEDCRAFGMAKGIPWESCRTFCVFYGVRYLQRCKGMGSDSFWHQERKDSGFGENHTQPMRPSPHASFQCCNSARDQLRRPLYQPVSSSTYRGSS